MVDELLIQKLLKECQKIRGDIENDLENAADTLRHHKRKTKGNLYIARAYQNLHQLELAIDKLAASAIDFELLFRRLYDEDIFKDDERMN